MSHIENGEDFYLVLPSNVNSSHDNTPSKYHTQLINTINLPSNSRWEVGLVEISFVNAIKTIDKGESIHYCEDKGVDRIEAEFILDDHCGLYQNKYRTINLKSNVGLGNIITHPDFDLDWHEDAKRFSISTKNDKVLQISMSPYTAFVLGFISNRLVGDEELIFDGSDKKRNQSDDIITWPFTAVSEARIIVDHVRKGKIPDPNSNEPLSKPSELMKTEYRLIVGTGEGDKLPEPFKFFIKKRLQPPWKVLQSMTIPQGYYQTAEKLVKEANKQLAKFNITTVSFSYDESINRIVYKSENEGDFFLIDESIADVFGFHKMDRIGGLMMTAPYPPDLRRGIYSLYVYCDFCMETFVGNTLVPLLRTVSFNARAYGETVTVLYDNPIYVPINKRAIDSVEIKIGDDNGKLVPFVEGKTALTLHFRPA